LRGRELHLHDDEAGALGQLGADANFTRRSMPGITRPRRLTPPLKKAGVGGSEVIFGRRMISRTFSTALPEASFSRTTVR
jgi:hypothetical protein